MIDISGSADFPNDIDFSNFKIKLWYINENKWLNTTYEIIYLLYER